MGIIAGIAVPVTIAVINRQKKNSAAKSAEAVVATMKQLTQELIAQANSTVEISLVYTAATDGSGTNVPSTATVKIDGTEQTGYQPSEFVVENLKAVGTLTSTYYAKADETHAIGTYSFTVTGFKVNNYDITVSNAGVATAS